MKREGSEAPLEDANANRGAARRLEGLKQKPMWMTHMGCLIGCAEFLKSKASPAWICGGCGHAFALNVHEALCPSGPTAWPAEKCDTLAANLGLAVSRAQGSKAEKDAARKREAIWREVCEAIDAGMPCFGWELDLPEWYVVWGYDAEGNYLFGELGQPGKAHHAKLGDTGIGWAVVAIVRPGKAADGRTIVRDALLFALEHGAGKHSNEKWHTGLSGYDTWLKALEDSKLVAENKVIGFGHAYNAQCWAECRRHAVAFLEEAKRRLADERLAPLFDEGLKHYRVVSANLAAVAGLFPFNESDGKGMDERLRDTERRVKAIQALRAARDAEGAGLKALARIAVVLGASDIDPDKVGAPAAAPAAGRQAVLDGALEVARTFGKRTHEAYHQTRCWVSARSICLAAAGAPNADYETLMTVTGLGTCFAYHPKHFWVTYWPPSSWEEAQQRVTQATGFEWEDLSPAKTPEEAWTPLKETIDSGRALMGFFYMGEHVFLGYQDAAKTEDRRVLLACPFEYQGEWWPWEKFAQWSKKNAFGRIGEKAQPAGAKAVAIEAMGRAVASAGGDDRAKRKEVPPDVKFGLAGMEGLAADIADMSKGRDTFDGGWLGCHAIMPQISGRRCAAVYFRRLSKEFPKRAADHMRAAADAYDAAFAAWQEWREHLGGTDERRSLDDLKKAWHVKKNRQAGAAAIRRAIEHEKAAVKAVKAALAALRG